MNVKQVWKKCYMLFILLVILSGLCGVSASAATDWRTIGRQIGNTLESGTDIMKGDGTLSYECISVIYNDQYDQSCGYRTLLINGKGVPRDYTIGVFCGDLPETPWHASFIMNSAAYAFIGEGITSLGQNFMGSMYNMMYIDLPNSLTSIGEYAFAGCNHLRRINIPRSVTSIADTAFELAKNHLTIYCESGSYAHTYAVKNGIKVYLTDKSECENIGHQGSGIATCTTPRLCRICGAQVEAALGHQWGEWYDWYYGKQRRNCTRCSGNETRSITKVSAVVVEGAPKTLLAGKTVDLSVKVSPSGAANKAVKWSSSNTKYASVTQEGIVTVKAAGAGKTVTITAAAIDGSGGKGTCKIKIKGAVKKVKLKAAKKTVKAGKNVKITAAVTVGKGGSKALKWTTSNKKYATVSSKGVVTAKKAGKGKTVKIIATAKDGSGKKASVTIKIK